MGKAIWIRASEIGTYCYCNRSWWLQYVLGLEPEERGQLRGGVGEHRSYARRVVAGQRLQRAGVVTLLLALALGAVAVIWLIGRGS